MAMGYADKNDANINTLSAQLTLAMTIIQGVALVHKASKQFLGRRYPLEVCHTSVTLCVPPSAVLDRHC